MATQTYFLGANTKAGFYSCYGGFCPPESGNFLWVLKGGPGCGKSTFMRKIGQFAENRGLDVQYVLCSGDPDSLDGVYIPALKLGYVDGTAPHTLDVPYPAIRGAYLDLGQYYDHRALRHKADSMLLSFRRYREEYAAAYEKLAALPPLQGAFAAAKQGIRRFYHAICCKGVLSLPLPYLTARVTAETLNTIKTAPEDLLLLHPLEPEILLGVCLVREQICYLTDCPIPDCEPALAHFRAAKSLHDDLEALYNPHVDFDGVEAEAQTHIKKYLANVLSIGEK